MPSQLQSLLFNNHWITFCLGRKNRLCTHPSQIPGLGKITPFKQFVFEKHSRERCCLMDKWTHFCCFGPLKKKKQYCTSPPQLLKFFQLIWFHLCFVFVVTKKVWRRKENDDYYRSWCISCHVFARQFCAGLIKKKKLMINPHFPSIQLENVFNVSKISSVCC